MSNTPGSVVLTRYDGGLVVHASRRGWPTQSSTAAIGLLISLALHTGAHRGQPADLLESLDKGLLGVATAMDRTARVLDGPTREWARQIADATLILFAGAGPHFAAAAFGAAKVRELSPIHAQAMPLEEYHHYRSQKLRDPLFLLAPDARSRERALDTALVSADVGGRTVALLPGPDPDIEARVSATWRLPPSHSALAPLLYSVPMHLFAFHFAEARFEANLGHPALLTEA
jgi:glucosamine--fructose-6-phosphate aminotransferase (isomerizing)